jgi:GGDEF domain-containing protein
MLIFAAYKLYMRFAYAAAIEWTAFLWPVIVLGALGGMTLFISLFSVIEGVNGILNKRLDELTVMDPLTGLENMRSMIMSLKRYMALSRRNGTEMGLMLVRLRYADEIKKVLTRAQFGDLRHNIAITVQNALRLEDRVFSIDENGSLGIIYFSKEAGVTVVKSRVLSAVANKNMLPDLNEQALTVELSAVYKQYDASYGDDVMRYISDLEKEFAYEV